MNPRRLPLPPPLPSPPRHTHPPNHPPLTHSHLTPPPPLSPLPPLLSPFPRPPPLPYTTPPPAVTQPKNSLTGYIPESFFTSLTNLTYIDLSFNQISGTISKHVENARTLEWFSLGNNRLSGTIPSEIDGIGTNLIFEDSIDASVQDRGLTHLDFSYNNLSGTVPTDIGELGHLKLIDFSHNPWLGDNLVNLFSDPGNPNYRGLPEEIGKLHELETLRLDYSAFGGFVPTQIGSLAKLRYFFARGWGQPNYDDRNHFSGTLPTEIGRLDKLHTFRIPHNRISGTLPVDMKEMTVLRHFDAQENWVSGTLPEVFTGLKKLTLWDTYANSIVGNLPQSMVNASNLRYLYLNKEQALFIANSRCQVRVPGIGNHDAPRDSRSKLRGQGTERNKYNWYQLAADYFKLRDPFVLPADGGVPFRCETGSEEGCNGRTDCDPGVENSCPGVDELGMPKRYSMKTSGINGGDMFKKRWAGVMYCVDKYDEVQTFLRLCEMEGDCDEEGYSRQTDPHDDKDTGSLFAGTTGAVEAGAYTGPNYVDMDGDGDVDSADGSVIHHMPTDDGGAEAPLGRRLEPKVADDGEASSLAEDAKLAREED